MLDGLERLVIMNDTPSIDMVDRLYGEQARDSISLLAMSLMRYRSTYIQ